MAINSNTQLYDNAVDRAAMLRLYERRVNQKVDTRLEEHSIGVDELIKGASTSGRGQKEFFENLRIENARTFKEINNSTSSSMLDLVSDQVSHTYNNVTKTFGKIWKVERPPVRVAEDIVLKRPLYNDQTLLEGWSSIGVNSRMRLEGIIRKGIASGDDLDKIAEDVLKGSAHRITKTQSRSLVVTAVTSVTAQADLAVYDANKGAISGWQYIAILDLKTSAVCAHRNGKIFSVLERHMLPPAHYNCRSRTVPVFKSWEDIANLEGVAQVRRRNIEDLKPEERAFYDGMTPLKEPYHDWLLRQPQTTQVKHLGDYKKVDLFNSGGLHVDSFVNPEGNSIGINELRALTQATAPGDSRRFASAKLKLDSMQLGINTPDELIGDTQMQAVLKDYYKLQAGELDGTLSLTNYRGMLIGSKKASKNRVLTSPPTEAQLKFNPITGRYEDIRMYQPNVAVLSNNKRLVMESSDLLDSDKAFITKFVDDLADTMSVNERAAVSDNLRIIFTRYRKDKEVWKNFKAISQAQIKFDVMNVSDAIETQIRRDTDILKKLTQSNYIDPVLGATQLQELHDKFISNILRKNLWEDRTAPKIARELRSSFDSVIAKSAPTIWSRLSDKELQQFYLKFSNRLSLADSPDKDQLAVQLGRDLHNLAGYNGSRMEWYRLGDAILTSKNVSKFFAVETFGVQKRRMKSRLSGAYFGPYYDTLSYNIRVVDPRIQEYAQLTRKVDLGLRVAVTQEDNKLFIRKGFKTYFIKRRLGYVDTRIPITSTSSFSDFPEEFIDDKMVEALNWASKTQYKIDKDYYDFTKKLLYFEDDRGAAKKYNELNEYKKYISSRSDSYERFKAMEWLRDKDRAFSNHAFIDHRARIYDRGLISPQSGETFRPFLNTAHEKYLVPDDFYNFKDQIGAFVGGISDKLEGRYNSLTFTGRQKIADQWRPELVKLGNHMLRGKPADIRAILDSPLVQEIDGEELGKFYRFAIEYAKIDKHLGGDYTPSNINKKIVSYKTALALEQDASSSGAQIIALTTRNKQLAELSNVLPTSQKKRLYDEIAAATFQDPRFKELNKRLGLTEKDLRKAAKA